MNREPVDICLIEDDAAQRAALRRQLMPLGYRIVDAESGHAALELIYQHRPPVVICDLMMPELSGINVCERIRSDPLLDGTYIIVVTAVSSRKLKHQALHAGADDFLAKPVDKDELIARIRNGIRLSRMQERLRRAAVTDSMTDLWNHTEFRTLLDREFARTRRYGTTASVLMLDLDHFKAVNDTYGHEVGNDVIKRTARHLLEMVRDTDIVARYGGEELAVICPHTSLEDAEQLAERIRRSLPERTRLAQCPQLNVTASIGVASTSDFGVNSVSDLIDAADKALYAAKRGGRNRVRRSDDISEESVVADRVRIDEVERLRKQVVTLSMQAKDLCLQSVWALVQALDARDHFTVTHSRNVTVYVQRLSRASFWPAPLRAAVAQAAMLHDLGKIGVPDGILQKAEKLTESEAAILRQVPLMTCKILEPLRVFDTEVSIIRHLRERFDGSGHPDGLVGESIPIGSRLLAIAEAYDALTCDRAYRPRRSIDEALDVLTAAAGQQFDPQFVDLLRAAIAADRGSWQRQIDEAHLSTHEAHEDTNVLNLEP